MIDCFNVADQQCARRVCAKQPKEGELHGIGILELINDDAIYLAEHSLKHAESVRKSRSAPVIMSAKSIRPVPF